MHVQAAAEYIVDSLQSPLRQQSLLASAKICKSLLRDIGRSGDLDRLVESATRTARTVHLPSPARQLPSTRLPSSSRRPTASRTPNAFSSTVSSVRSGGSGSSKPHSRHRTRVPPDHDNGSLYSL